MSIFLYNPRPAAAPDGDGTGTGGVTDHGDLTGLTGDDHTMYARVDGTRTFPVDHGTATGLADDDHTLYARADGTRPFTGPITVNGDTVWHAGNDGAASGLDADLLDGQQGSYYTGLAGHAHYSTEMAGVTAATPLSEYPTVATPQRGVFYATCVTADGWPVQGTVLTVKRSDNYGYQEVVERITAASGTPRRYYRATNSTGVWQAFKQIGGTGRAASVYSSSGTWTTVPTSYAEIPTNTTTSDQHGLAVDNQIVCGRALYLTGFRGEYRPLSETDLSGHLYFSLLICPVVNGARHTASASQFAVGKLINTASLTLSQSSTITGSGIIDTRAYAAGDTVRLGLFHQAYATRVPSTAAFGTGSLTTRVQVLWAIEL
jgi:ribosomal protein L27